MTPDPLASMRCWAIGVTLGGQEYTIPAAPAVAWWPVLADLDATVLLDMIRDPDLTDRLWQGEIEPSEIGEALIEAVEQASGRPIMASLTIASLAAQHWASINGQLVRDGVRWDVLPLAAVLDAIHSLLLDRFADGKNDKTGRLYRDDYLAALETPMPGSGTRVSRQALTEFETMAGPRPAARPARSSGALSGDTPSRTRTPSRPPRRPALSGAPIEQPATPGRSDRPARNVPLPAAGPPASGTASHLRRR